MKTRNIIFCLIALLAFSSCQDMFDPADENNRQEDAMDQESLYAYGLQMYAYSRLPIMTTCRTDVATDDAVTNNLSSDYLTMAKGTWASDFDPMSQWDACKDGIQYVNLFLSKVNDVKWSPSSPKKQQMFIERLKGEAFGLRAIMYFYLLQAHAGYTEDGTLYGVPMLKEPENGSSDFNQKRATFAECIKQCFEDCDSAIALLPKDYKDIMNPALLPEKYKDVEITGYNLVFGTKAKNLLSGRVAEAIKAQIALFAASPAYSDQSNVSYEKAADLCANVLNGIKGLSGFDETGHVDWYSYQYKNMIESTSEVPEILWREDIHDNRDQERENFPPSLYGSALVNPSQNLVDAFPMRNGLPISDPNSGYDPQDPYKNRDTRLANTVIYHGSSFKKNAIMTGVNMPYGSNSSTDDNLISMEKSTRTGYYMKKLLREDVSANPSSSMNQKHIYPRLRYTEFFLAYAEAANEAWGPEDDRRGYGYTAYSIIKKIRERAGIGIGYDDNGKQLKGDEYLEKIKSDKDKMRELIRNERRLELCFENKRFWDLRRWLMPLNEAVRGMKVERSNPDDVESPLIYTPFEVEARKFTHKDGSYQWYGPIPKSEILKWSNLEQNKGW